MQSSCNDHSHRSLVTCFTVRVPEFHKCDINARVGGVKFDLNYSIVYVGITDIQIVTSKTLDYFFFLFNSEFQEV